MYIIFKNIYARKGESQRAGFLALSIWSLFFTIVQVRATLKMAYVLKCLWAIEGARTVVVLITDTQEMLFDLMIVPCYKPRPNTPGINEIPFPKGPEPLKACRKT